jgi:primosomal protein N' (replication factor Y)
MVKITLKHRDFNRVEAGAQWLGKSLQNVFRENVLGPTTPSVSKVRNLYIRIVLIKIPPKQSLKATKENILKVKNVFQAVKDFRPIRFIVDVDNY